MCYKTISRLSILLGDGLIQEKELQHVMRACMDENGMKFDEGEVDELNVIGQSLKSDRSSVFLLH